MKFHLTTISINIDLLLTYRNRITHRRMQAHCKSEDEQLCFDYDYCSDDDGNIDRDTEHDVITWECHQSVTHNKQYRQMSPILIQMKFQQPVTPVNHYLLYGHQLRTSGNMSQSNTSLHIQEAATELNDPQIDFDQLQFHLEQSC